MNLLFEDVSVGLAPGSWRFAAHVAALDLEADAADELFAIAGSE